MTMKSADAEVQIARATADIAAERVCLKCRSPFWSVGLGERICSLCKASSVWRAAISKGGGHGRRRSGGRSS